MYTGRLAMAGAKKRYIPAVLLFGIALCVSLVLAESKKSPPVTRRASVRLRHISNTEAISTLQALKLGSSVTSLPKSPETLLIVSEDSTELDKARLVLEIIDSERKYSLQTIKDAQGKEGAAVLKDIAVKLPGFVIGSFDLPPSSVTKNPKVMVDVRDSKLFVIAPTDSINLVVRTVNEVISAVPAGETDKQGRIVRSSVEKTEPNAAVSTSKPVEEQSAEDSMDAFRRIINLMGGKDQPPVEPNQVSTKTEKPTEAAAKPAEKAAEEEQPKDAETATASKAIDETKVVDPAATIAEPDEEVETILTLPQKVDILKLIELVGKQLELNYIYDAARVKGDVMLKIHDGNIKVKDLYALLENVLKFKGFVMTRRGNLVEIKLASDIKNIEAEIRDPGDPIDAGEVVIATMFKLKHIDTTSATNLLKGMNLGLRIDPIAASNTIIVTGYAYRMPRIEKLLAMVDIASEPRRFEFKQLKYTMAADLVVKLQKLTEQLDSVTIAIGAKAVTKAPVRSTPGRSVPRTPVRPTTTAAKPITKKTVYIDVDERTNRVLMIGSDSELATVMELIETLDIPPIEDGRKIRQYDIENVAAEEVESVLIQLGIVGKSTSSSSQRRTSTTSTRPPTSSARPPTSSARPPTSSSSNSGNILDEEPQVVVLASTNSLLVNGTPEQHDKIAMIIGYVDKKDTGKDNPYVIYSLENQEPDAMAEILTKVIKETTKTATSSDPKLKTTSVPYDQEDEVIIVPDENTFSLIVYATRKQQDQIAQLIEILDKRRPQVLIDVTLVEITKDDEFTYDLNLVSSFPDMLNPTGLVGDVSSVATSAVNTMLDTSGQDRLIDVSSVGGTGKAFYADNHIQALLTLMETNNYGRVLAQPKVLVNDNEEGTINTEKTIYIARTSQTSDPTTGTAVAHIQTNTSFDNFISGINLTIIPNISEGDLLRLDIELIRSQQDSPSVTTANTPPPPRTENNIHTIVTVPNKSTIILGGIQQLSQQKGGSKVPLLGDIPFIGGLFRSTSNFDKQTKLYIFVKATILRPDETEAGLPDLIEESDLYRAAYEEAEQDWQEHKTWPGVKPKTVKPEKLLDVR
ncbi:MAG: hypothetical protein KAS23_04070 [Anaerohalosphaera sp.]|nr:hypothetical protein [Anaerohalosphaera sp.]